MPWTTDQLARLRKAYAAGVLSVRDADGKTVTYRSLDDLARAIETVAAFVEGQQRPTVTYVRHKRDRC